MQQPNYTQPQIKAYQEGKQAFNAQQSRDTNPYLPSNPKQFPLRLAWFDGWREGYDEYNKTDTEQ